MRMPLLAAVLLAVLAPAMSAQAADAPGAGTPVLNAQSFWCCHLTWKTEMVRSESGALGPVEVAAGKPAKVTGTALPPDSWSAPGFDDSAWVRLQAPIRCGRSLVLICLRGKCEVRDPVAFGELELVLDFRGGAVVYLNGEEIGRSHVAGGKGKVDLQAAAEDYPKEAYVRPDGISLLQLSGSGDPVTYKDRIALRARKLTVRLPKTSLRKGVNVLALELHRAPTHEVMHKGKKPEAWDWTMLGYQGCTLTASGGAAVVSNVSRPAGFRIWNHSVMTAVNPGEYADPNESLGPVQIVGCRNGAFSGQLVAGSTEAVKGLTAEPSALKGPGGAEIPASAVQVRWASAIRTSGYDFGMEALELAPPAEVPATKQGAVQPILVTVNVPKDAKPGDYTGKLTVNAGATAVEAAIGLKVVDYTLPDARDYCSHAGLVQSPDSLALRYNMPNALEGHRE